MKLYRVIDGELVPLEEGDYAIVFNTGEKVVIPEE